VTRRPVFRRRVGKHVSTKIPLGHKPSLGVKQRCPWIWEWKLYTLRNQIVATELTGMSMDMSKQQASPRIPQRYINGHPDKNRSSHSRKETQELIHSVSWKPEENSRGQTRRDDGRSPVRME
jgi:hypothetical protein